MDAMTEYPGLNFTPPEGAVDPKATEGEAMVKWKKVGDAYTIVEFDGQPLSSGEESAEPAGMGMSADEELTSMGAAQPEA